MRVATAAFLAAFLSLPVVASGPYSPPLRIVVRLDTQYERGKALYVDGKLGSGKSCSSCHVDANAISKKKLASLNVALKEQVGICVRKADRVNGAIGPEDLEALAHFVAKRYGL